MQHLPNSRGIARPRLLQRALDNRAPFDHFKLDILARLELLFDLVTPALEKIGPCVDRVSPASDRIERKTADPAIVVIKDEGRLAPIRILVAMLYDGAQFVVPVAEDVGPDLEPVADNPLDRIAAAVDFRIHLLNLDPRFRPPQRMRQRAIGGGPRHAQDPQP